MFGGRILSIFSVLAGLVGALSAWAGEAPPAVVGRVNAVDGAVATRPTGGAWSDSGVNEPIAAGMSVRTGPQARAMLRIGADSVALAAGTEIDIAELDARGTHLVLRQGRLGVRLSRREPQRRVEIDIPQGGVWPLVPGDYDITAGDEHTPGRLAVLDGRARFAGNGVDNLVATGSAGTLNGNNPVVTTLDGATADAFIAWWRPDRADPVDPPALRYVSAEMTGYDALDENGSWQKFHGFGAVWFPSALPADWAPYRFGRWRWIAPWGWTWIDDEPWGFAPSHYGRWTRIPGADDDEPERWGWIPGKQVEYPAYMPAAVAFLGTAGVGLSYPDAFAPAVAWFPLAPGEVYWPGYTDDIDAIRRLNAGSVTDPSAIDPGIHGDPPAEIVNGDYLYRRFASVVPRSVFTGGRLVAAAQLQLPERRLENAPLLAGSPEIAPATPRAPLIAAVGRGAAAKLARAQQTLARILKPRGAPAAARAAVLVRSAHAAAGRTHVSRIRPGRLRIVASPVRNGHSHVRLAAARRR